MKLLEIAKKKKQPVAYIPVNISRKEAQEIFEFELKLMGLEFIQRHDNHNEYIISEILDKDILKSLSIKWYIRDLTEYYDKHAEKHRKLRIATQKRIEKILGLIPISHYNCRSSNSKLPPDERTIIEFMGPKL